MRIITSKALEVWDEDYDDDEALAEKQRKFISEEVADQKVAHIVTRLLDKNGPRLPIQDDSAEESTLPNADHEGSYFEEDSSETSEDESSLDSEPEEEEGRKSEDMTRQNEIQENLLATTPALRPTQD